jgi:YaiO family outer membrane protein
MNYRHTGTIGCAVLAALMLLGGTRVAGAAPVDHYAVGMREVQKAIANGDLTGADSTLKRLSKSYGNNVELLSVRGRVLFWLKHYNESISFYRAAIKLKPTPELRAELKRVETAQQLAEADRLISQRNDAQAEIILRNLYQSGTEPYESGLRLARLRMRADDYRGASDVLGQMLKQFPQERDLVLLKAQALLGGGAPEEALAFLAERPETVKDAQLLALRGRAQMRLQRFEKAAESFAASLALADDPQVRQERERSELAEVLQRADRMIAAGDFTAAQTLLKPYFEAGRDRYETGVRLASLSTKLGNQQEAARLYQILMKEYPKEPEFAVLSAQALVNLGKKEAALELLDRVPQGGSDPRVSALRGRIFFLQGRYLAARQEYDKAMSQGGTAELGAERSAAEQALNYESARSQVEAHDYELALPLLKTLSAGGSYALEARLLTGRVMIAKRQQEAARSYCEQLYRDYPANREVAVLYAETLVMTGEGARAEEVLERAEGTAGADLKKEREDLFFLARGNWVKLFGEVYGYSKKSYPTENGAGVMVSQRFKRFTLVGSALENTRFGKTDPQLALDLYRGRGEGENYSGSVSATLSPGAHFLPQSSIGGELTRNLKPLDLSVGYNRLNFRNSGANVVSASLLWYLPATTLSLGEKVYWVPENASAMWVTSLHWDPDYRYRVYCSGGVGNSSERVETVLSAQDVKRYFTYALRAGGEYRFSPSYSVGGEGSFESRRGLYDRSGANLFVKYWWP